ncbi:sweet taste receptor activity protein [Homalodisca vitripennis]|nr:sweet taste receptor activity protein [Homalodisca vitripennis]
MDLPGLLQQNVPDSHETSNLRNVLCTSVKRKNLNDISFMRVAEVHKEYGGDNENSSISMQLKKYFSITRWCLLFPVQGVKEDGQSSMGERSWKCNARVLCLMSITASIILFLIKCGVVLKKNINYYTVTEHLLRSLMVISVKMVFLKQASQWPDLVKQWNTVEVKLSPLFHNHRTANDSGEDFNSIINVYLAATLIYTGMDYLRSLEVGLQCGQSFLEIVNLTMVNMHFYLFSITSFSVWKCVVLTFIHLQEKMVWMLMDLNVILLSRSICLYFRRINTRLIQSQHKRNPKGFWLYMRESYNSVSNLSKQVDQYLSWMNVFCFGSPLYFITSALLRIFSPAGDMNRISDLFKLVYMVGCFIITSHSASALHQESKVPAKILFSVPAESYNTDVARFQVQACQYNTVITGCNYFSITKSFMLTVAGTIVTYEIVLLQFGSLVYYKVPSNMTQFCNGLKGATYSESSR